jgi:hypothetical protein
MAWIRLKSESVECLVLALGFSGVFENDNEE